MELCKKAAEQGTLTLDMIELMQGNGDGVSQSNAEAAEWYRLAAEQRYVKAQENLNEIIEAKHTKKKAVTNNTSKDAYLQPGLIQMISEYQNMLDTSIR